MMRYRTRLPIGVIAAAALAVWGCTPTGSQPQLPADPAASPTAQPSETAASAQPSASPSPEAEPADPTAMPSDAHSTPYGVRYVDLKVGTGASPEPGQTCVVHYTGWLKEDGRKFDSSVDRGQPYEFPHQRGRVIRGWDEGIATMKVGGKRKLEIPPNLAYGEQGTHGIPANATLVFDIELLEIK